MTRYLSEPCDNCPASEECWNYGKEPDPAKPGGPFRISGWFDCHLPASPANVRGEVRTIDAVVTQEALEAALLLREELTMADPTPSDVSTGTLDMTLRALLLHMLRKKLDHVVLVAPGNEARISITLAGEEQTRQITQSVQRILTP